MILIKLNKTIPAKLYNKANLKDNDGYTLEDYLISKSLDVPE